MQALHPHQHALHVRYTPALLINLASDGVQLAGLLVDAIVQLCLAFVQLCLVSFSQSGQLLTLLGDGHLLSGNLHIAVSKFQLKS